MKAAGGRVLLVHWSRPECRGRLSRLRAAGWRATAVWDTGRGAFDGLRERPPDAFVIDLGRIPSHGREVGVALRTFRETRGVPLVFVGGTPESGARVRGVLPDATFAEWDGIAAALRTAVDHPPAEPVKPGSILAGYSGTPLPKKLGVKPGAVVALEGAPRGFEATLGTLPEGAVTRRGPGPAPGLTLWFVRSQAEFRKGLRRMKPRGAGGGLWICWPKKASGIPSDLSEGFVRGRAMDAGLVDFKVCAVDATWSGLRFSIRK